MSSRLQCDRCEVLKENEDNPWLKLRGMWVEPGDSVWKIDLCSNCAKYVMNTIWKDRKALEGKD